MRRKIEMTAQSFSVSRLIHISFGYFFLTVLLIFHLLNFFFKLFEIYPFLPNYNTLIWQELLILVGAPLLLILSFVLSFKNKRLCGAILLFGSALISAGIAFQSGYFIKIYLLKMAIIGLPQILAGIFFLKSGK
ncbi:MAG: hypothetical protein N2445_05385 [Acidobacteria bacterium]|nr:hypothetical protein [Acidobacteriota bacterium]